MTGPGIHRRKDRRRWAESKGSWYFVQSKIPALVTLLLRVILTPSHPSFLNLLPSLSPRYDPVPLYFLNLSNQTTFFLFTATLLALPTIISHLEGCKSLVTSIPLAHSCPFQSILYTVPSDLFKLSIWLCHPSLRTLQWLPTALRRGTKFLDNISGACMGWGLLGSLSLNLLTLFQLFLYVCSMCCPFFLEHSSCPPSLTHVLTLKIPAPGSVPTTALMPPALLMKRELSFSIYSLIALDPFFHSMHPRV